MSKFERRRPMNELKGDIAEGLSPGTVGCWAWIEHIQDSCRDMWQRRY